MKQPLLTLFVLCVGAVVLTVVENALLPHHTPVIDLVYWWGLLVGMILVKVNQ